MKKFIIILLIPLLTGCAAMDKAFLQHRAVNTRSKINIKETLNPKDIFKGEKQNWIGELIIFTSEYKSTQINHVSTYKYPGVIVGVVKDNNDVIRWKISPTKPIDITYNVILGEDLIYKYTKQYYMTKVNEIYIPDNSIERYITFVRKEHPDWSDSILQTIKDRKIKLYMTSDQVRLSWGLPGDINRTVSSRGVREQWVYSETYVYFEDGILTSWQD